MPPVFTVEAHPDRGFGAKAPLSTVNVTVELCVSLSEGVQDRARRVEMSPLKRILDQGQGPSVTVELRLSPLKNAKSESFTERPRPSLPYVVVRPGEALHAVFPGSSRSILIGPPNRYLYQSSFSLRRATSCISGAAPPRAANLFAVWTRTKVVRASLNRSFRSIEGSANSKALAYRSSSIVTVICIDTSWLK